MTEIYVWNCSGSPKLDIPEFNPIHASDVTINFHRERIATISVRIEDVTIHYDFDRFLDVR